MEKNEFFADARDDLTGPLSGVRVLEITTTWAGPMAGVVLADLGADTQHHPYQYSDLLTNSGNEEQEDIA